MPNTQYLNAKVAQAAGQAAHEEAPSAFSLWASRLTDDQLRGALQVLLAEAEKRGKR